MSSTIRTPGVVFAASSASVRAMSDGTIPDSVTLPFRVEIVSCAYRISTFSSSFALMLAVIVSSGTVSTTTGREDGCTCAAAGPETPANNPTAPRNPMHAFPIMATLLSPILGPAPAGAMPGESPSAIDQ
jgi:hypothetical protein